MPSRLRLRVVTLLVFSFFAVLGAVACGGDDDAAAPVQPQAESAPEPVPEPAPDPAPAAPEPAPAPTPEPAPEPTSEPAPAPAPESGAASARVTVVVGEEACDVSTVGELVAEPVPVEMTVVNDDMDESATTEVYLLAELTYEALAAQVDEDNARLAEGLPVRPPEGITLKGVAENVAPGASVDERALLNEPGEYVVICGKPSERLFLSESFDVG